MDKRNRKRQAIVCSSCGAEVIVVKDCECDDCGIVCCGEPMEPKGGQPGGCCGC